MWWLYLRVQTQWRLDPIGNRIGLDYSPAFALIHDLRWDLVFVQQLLQAIELQALPKKDGDD